MQQKDINALIDQEKQIIKQEQEQVKLEPIAFDKTNAPPVAQEKDTTGQLVNQALSQAVIHTVQTDGKVQERILGTANKVIDNAMNEAEARAEQKDKEAHFNNHKSACECWGYDEKDTKKLFVNIMNAIHNVFTAIWIVIGTVTFAPVVFVGKKIKVIIKKTWVAMLLAAVIYVAIILTPMIVALVPK